MKPNVLELNQQSNSDLRETEEPTSYPVVLLKGLNEAQALLKGAG